MIKVLNERLYDYNGNFSVEEYYLFKFGTIPEKYYSDYISPDFDTKFHEKYKAKKLTCYTFSNTNGVIAGSVIWELEKQKVYVRINTSGEYLDVTIFHKESDFATELIKFTHEFYSRRKWTENKISILLQTPSGEITTQDFAIKVGEINVEINYGKEFVPIYEKILSRLHSENDKGLILFHGLPGTGKTSLIKYISKQLKKEVLFIPSNLGESLCSPSFIPFLLRHSNSVLIIEDAEKIIADRDSQASSFGVSNILNISDGILGDCLNIQIIATFNTKRDKIDPALLRKGRLIAEYEFGKLNISQSNDLIKYLGIEHITETPLTVGEIYNLGDSEFKTNKNEKIGFEFTAIKNNTASQVPEVTRY